MRNGAAFNESIVFARDYGYAYRTGMGMMNSAEFAHFFDDFRGPFTTNVPLGWTDTIIDTGATLVASTTAGSLGATGGALIASDGVSEGTATYIGKSIQLTATKRFFMEARVQTSVAAQTDVQFGLSDLTAVANPEDLWTTTSANLVAFGTLAGSATLKMLSDKANSGSTAESSSGSLENTTWATLAFLYDGVGLSAFKDGNLVLTWSQAATTIPNGVALAPFFGGRTGAGAGNVTTFDFVRYVIER